MKLPKFTALLLAGSLAFALAACGTPTVEGADRRYKANKDKISVLITKQPANKAEFDAKLAEFEQEYATAMAAASDEDKIKQLNSLNSRVDKYLAAFETPAPAAPQGGQAAPSNKLDGAAGAAPVDGAAGTAPAGGKLDAAGDASGGMGGAAVQSATGGMGGTAQPATGGMGGAAPAQPAAGGMGGM